MVLRSIRFFCLTMLVAAIASGCASILPTVAEEAADPQSPPRKIAAYQVRRWTSRPVSKLEKQFDFNRNGVLEPEELARLRMARGFFQSYGNVWKYDKNHDWRFNQEEYYDETHQE